MLFCFSFVQLSLLISKTRSNLLNSKLDFILTGNMKSVTNVCECVSNNQYYFYLLRLFSFLQVSHATSINRAICSLLHFSPLLQLRGPKGDKRPSSSSSTVMFSNLVLHSPLVTCVFVCFYISINRPDILL